MTSPVLARSRWCMYAGLASIAVLVALSPDFGATWDEPQQRQKAHHLLAYWTGQSPVLEVPDDGAHLYGAPLDVLAAMLEPLVPAGPYVIRHAVIAAAAGLGVMCAGLLALRLFGVAEGLVTIALLLASPFFIAHATNNPKDLPFAVVGVAWLLALSRLPPEVPLRRVRDIALLAALLGLGLNVRAGALLFWAYLAVFCVLRSAATHKSLPRAVVDTGPRLVLVLGGALSIGWLAWPWAYDQPLTAPFRGLAMLSKFPWGGQVLFDGASYAGLEVPDTYIVRWFWMALPPVVLGGALCSLLLWRSERRLQVLALWSAVLFPVVYVAGTRATLYDGVRHLLFVVPPLTVLSAAGLVQLCRLAPARIRWFATAGILAAAVEPVWFQVRNHPNQAAYIQPLAGGPRAAFARFDLDYWGNCLLEAMRRASALEGEPRVLVTGWPLIVLEANAPRVPGVVLVGEASHARRFVQLVRGSREDILRLSGSPDIVSRVSTADGAVLCVVRSLDHQATSR